MKRVEPFDEKSNSPADSDSKYLQRFIFDVTAKQNGNRWN